MRFPNLAVPWAIEPTSARHYLRVYDSIVARKMTDAELEAALPAPRGGVSDVRRFAVSEGVATINVRGPIVPHADLLSEVSGMATVEGIRAQLQQAIASEDVNAIIMSFDSPGGVTTGISDLAHAIRGASDVKPVVAFAEGLCCSAANWLAAGATSRVVSNTGIMGSIGTMMAYTDDRKAMEAIGLEDVEFIASQSPKKSPKHYEEEGKAQIQRLVDDNCAVFISDMAALYGVPKATVESDFGQGDVLTGKRAVKAGLADRVGNYDQVFAELARGKMPTRKTPLTGQSKGVSSMGFLEDLMIKSGWKAPNEEAEPEAVPVPVAVVPPAPMQSRREAELEAQVAEYKAGMEASRNADADAFANQYASFFLENGSEATGEESDRAKMTAKLREVYLLAAENGKTDVVAEVCKGLTAARPTASAGVLDEPALSRATPVVPVATNDDDTAAARKAASDYASGVNASRNGKVA